MVQIFSGIPEMGTAGQLGQALGMGIAKNLPKPEMLVQRRMLSEAFEKAKESAQDPNANPLDLTFDFLQATAGIPGAERYVGQVLPLILQRAKGQRGAQTPDPGQQPLDGPGVSPVAPQTPTPQFGKVAGEGAPIQAQNVNQFTRQMKQQGIELPEPDVETPNVFGGDLEPTALGMGPLPNTYSPQEIKRAEDEDLAAGFPSIRAQRMKEYNQVARDQISDYVTAAQNQAAVGEARAQRQEAFRPFLQAHTGATDPFELALAENIANEPRFRNISNDNIRAQKVAQEYMHLKANLDKFDKASERPNPYLPWSRGEYQDNFKVLNRNVQPLIKKGMRGEIKEKLANNGWTQTETEQIMNPLGSKEISQIKKLPRITQDLEISYFSENGTPSQFPRKVERQERKDLKTWENYLSKNIKPGKVDPKQQDVIQPGTSLLLLRNEFMKKGGNWQDFRDMVGNLQEQGKIKLGRFQEEEMQIISQKPINSITIEEFFLGTRSL